MRVLELYIYIRISNLLRPDSFAMDMDRTKATLLGVDRTRKRPEALPPHHSADAHLMSGHVLYAVKGNWLTPDLEYKD